MNFLSPGQGGVGGGDGCSLSRLRSLDWQERIFSVSVHPTEGPQRSPGGAQGVAKSTAQLATGIINSLHLLFSTSHIFSFYSSSFSRKISGYLTGSSQTSSFSPALSLQSARDTQPQQMDWAARLDTPLCWVLEDVFHQMVGVSVCVITSEWGLGAGRLPRWSCVVFSKRELQARELLPWGRRGGIRFLQPQEKQFFQVK